MQMIDTGADDVLGILVDGKVDEEDVKRVWTLAEERLEKHEKLRVYVELESFDGITLKATLEDLKQVFRNFRRFERKAIVSDKSWLGTFTKIGDKLFPSIEVKHFAPSEKDAALEWAKG